ncbi:MAG TPA: hypothetical protein VKY41_08505 [Xanthomarina sp.]|nr:hypothetical protein [Xanthomarina sp.]
MAPLLMATTCEDDLEENTIVYNVYKTQVTPEYSFSMNDTIWISGKISSKVYDEAVNDSIFLENPHTDEFSIHKFIEPTEASNCKDAVDAFELIINKGQLSFMPSCENGKLKAFPELENNNDYYSYRIGLKPNTNGDYVISWPNSMLQNFNRNEFIIDNYPIENHPNQIGFNSCGTVSWRYLNESDKEYYFTVE